MEFIECMEKRRSIRKYTDAPVDNETIEKIIGNARLAPTWKNSQSVRFTAVTDPLLKAKIADKGIPDYKKNTGIINGAPVLIVVSTVDKRSGYERDGSASTSKGPHWQSFDAGAASYALCLAAENEGLGTCIMGLFDEAAVAGLIGLSEGQLVSALIALGYPDEEPNMPKRKDVADILTII